MEYSEVNTTPYWCTYFRTYHMFGHFTANLIEINCVIKELNILQNFICKDIIIILINTERVSKHSVTIRGLRVVTTCWSWAWSNRTYPSKWVGLGSPLAASSVYGDLTCSVYTVNNLCMFNCQCHFYLCNRGPYVRLAFVPNMLSSWNKDIIIILLLSIYQR